MRFPLAWVVLLCGTIALVVHYRPQEDAMPDVGARPGPELVAVDDLLLDASRGLPALSAAHAAPDPATTPLAVGGVCDRLALDDVRIELGGGLLLRAAHGVLSSGGLEMRDVRVSFGERVALRGPAAQLSRGDTSGPSRLRCAGIAVLCPDTAAQEVVIDLECDLDTLARDLRRRMD